MGNSLNHFSSIPQLVVTSKSLKTIHIHRLVSMNSFEIPFYFHFSSSLWASYFFLFMIFFCCRKIALRIVLLFVTRGFLFLLYLNAWCNWKERKEKMEFLVFLCRNMCKVCKDAVCVWEYSIYINDYHSCLPFNISLRHKYTCTSIFHSRQQKKNSFPNFKLNLYICIMSMNEWMNENWNKAWAWCLDAWIFLDSQRGIFLWCTTFWIISPTHLYLYSSVCSWMEFFENFNFHFSCKFLLNMLMKVLKRWLEGSACVFLFLFYLLLFQWTSTFVHY